MVRARTQCKRGKWGLRSHHVRVIWRGGGLAMETARRMKGVRSGVAEWQSVMAPQLF